MSLAIPCQREYQSLFLLACFFQADFAVLLSALQWLLFGSPRGVLEAVLRPWAGFLDVLQAKALPDCIS